MRIRFLLGPAGTGKTFRCLREIREALKAAPEGVPLLLVAPKQTTYQLEHQLLAQPGVLGYTRLQILSFDRLAELVFERVHSVGPRMLDEEGRLMVLRSLLARKRDDLKLFRASARLTGFAQQLSQVLRELQRERLTPEALLQLSHQVGTVEGLAFKLQDLATLLRDYLGWLEAHQLLDTDFLIAAAAQALTGAASNVGIDTPGRGPQESIDKERKLIPQSERGFHAQARPFWQIDRIWVDGFSEFSEPELELLATLASRAGEITLTLCLEQATGAKMSWLSTWSVVRQSFEQCRRRFEAIPGADVSIEVESRNPSQTRFRDNPVLSHLEKHWSNPVPYLTPATSRTTNQKASSSGAKCSPVQGVVARHLRLVACANPEREVVLAAREILSHVRAGGRYREVTVLVRKLEAYHRVLQRVLARYEIPFFLDRRESVAHHPLAELTRSALRTVAFQWQRDDWFAALKTGLVPAEDIEIDRLENEALARGWKGAVWLNPIVVENDPELTAWLADLQKRTLPPFQKLALSLGQWQNKPTGPQLASALRDFWSALDLENTLDGWAQADLADLGALVPSSVHSTVWEQVNAWARNIELAFSAESLPLRDWLPILDAGLASLTVGVIPPALDQVLIGAIDRSRNPDIKLAIVLGVNESVFPAAPEPAVLLNEADRLELENRNLVLGSNPRRQLARERYYAYIACTRARERLVLTCAAQDNQGSPLNPSPFLTQMRDLFPSLELETVPGEESWQESLHLCELIAPLLKNGGAALANAQRLPALSGLLGQLGHFHNPDPVESLPSALADRLYGPVLKTSVSRMEQFAACPFRFFVHSGLRAEERKRFELDVREQGSFQHDVLALFHDQLAAEGKQWRDLTTAEARERIGHSARSLMASYRSGLLESSEETRFTARILSESLQDFVETLVDWMHNQYRFDPVAVELPFGQGEPSPPWNIELGGQRRLELSGRIDRIDLHRQPGSDEALCVVLDYKSSQKQLDPVLMTHGLQLQLLAYLNVLRRWPEPKTLFGVTRLIPAGVFYVNLRGKYERERNRFKALAETDEARKLAYRHSGRFDVSALRLLDARPEASEGDQFRYRLKKDGQLYKNSAEGLSANEFLALLDSVEAVLKRMGLQVYAGEMAVAPYRKGTVTACDQCDFQSICRIDPWTHRYRVLRKEQPE